MSEVIRVERRRRWSAADKLRIVAESRQPGSSVAAVAQRYGLHHSQLFSWRKAARDGCFSTEAPGFASVVVQDAPGQLAADHRALTDGKDCTGQIEIRLERGHITVSGRADPVSLRCVLEALSAR
ncbi:transposase [uncultured Ferrovibrio sp.]|jgi:transposase|uniref:IS66-like element accessory protein TnpA n=1 Tax=uncultured Ferrovibrio sp. TaxID=1576913 RepID=UPI00260CFD4E|nr:transposase [uncultured Ferrovibrio sp.]